jgi:acyl-CoA thioester hydrolase
MPFENGKHHTRIRVRYAETDKMGVAYNSHYLTWFEVGRTELLRDMGLTYETMERNGLLLPVIEAGIKYRKPARYDDVLLVWTSVGKKPGARIFLEYEIVRDDEIIASGFTEHAFTGTSLKPVKPPREILLTLGTIWEHGDITRRSLL